MAEERREVSAKECSYTITCLLFPNLKLQGLADGQAVQWQTVQKSKLRKGVDGYVAKNTMEVLYQGTFTFLPNAPCLKSLIILDEATTSKFGVKLTDIPFILTIKNNITRIKDIYTGGTILEAPGGFNASLENGVENVSFTFGFSNKVSIPF